jgi:hypothetical protein
MNEGLVRLMAMNINGRLVGQYEGLIMPDAFTVAESLGGQLQDACMQRLRLALSSGLFTVTKCLTRFLCNGMVKESYGNR